MPRQQTPPLVDSVWLSQRGGMYLTRAVRGHFIADRTQLVARMAELFDWIVSGGPRINIARRSPLTDAARAHRDIESGAPAGKIRLEV